jgi:hypothetical protein
MCPLLLPQTPMTLDLPCPFLCLASLSTVVAVLSSRRGSIVFIARIDGADYRECRVSSGKVERVHSAKLVSCEGQRAVAEGSERTSDFLKFFMA